MTFAKELIQSANEAQEIAEGREEPAVVFVSEKVDVATTLLGIAVASVKRQAARRKWPKRKGNDGRVTIGIPVTRL